MLVRIQENSDPIHGEVLGAQPSRGVRRSRTTPAAEALPEVLALVAEDEQEEEQGNNGDPLTEGNNVVGQSTPSPRGTTAPNFDPVELAAWCGCFVPGAVPSGMARATTEAAHKKPGRKSAENTGPPEPVGRASARGSRSPKPVGRASAREVCRNHGRLWDRSTTGFTVGDRSTTGFLNEGIAQRGDRSTRGSVNAGILSVVVCTRRCPAKIVS